MLPDLSDIDIVMWGALALTTMMVVRTKLRGTPFVPLALTATVIAKNTWYQPAPVAMYIAQWVLVLLFIAVGYLCYELQNRKVSDTLKWATRCCYFAAVIIAYTLPALTVPDGVWRMVTFVAMVAIGAVVGLIIQGFIALMRHWGRHRASSAQHAWPAAQPEPTRVTQTRAEPFRDDDGDGYGDGTYAGGDADYDHSADPPRLRTTQYRPAGNDPDRTGAQRPYASN